MAKSLNKVQIGLEFTADTRQAKQELNNLKKSLNEVIKLPGKASSLFDDSTIREASKSAQLLQNHLQAAVNVDTGKLDLSKFSISLKAANQNLNTHINNILKVGPSGQQAFLNLAKSISHAEMPTRRVNKALQEMATTLKNTARWQISSSILHGFMGALQSAYGYAQDLNESLNDIRIVTGYSRNEMAKFAKEANSAAKSLSTTTTEYTKASLIYYQQGLSGEQVRERADITVKMANVSKQSAQVVSDQMTAVWNNFYDGSQSLEHYADVMTKLGAATASSSDEIAQGLEKFAAISDTVGLSYEYAASALATVTAETRQSADVVGTAFKTIFARLEGLQLGDTLEDGTDLNKYSQALATVGVQIKDASGNMKDMDTILNDLGTRWQTLAQDEKIALAQTVAGVRQYNQLISLMDNWDTFQENLDMSKNADGSLEFQARIYAQSWEAAQKRVKAAAEDIYDSLLDDEFFIKLTDGFAKLLEAVSGFVDGFGGLKGIIASVGSIFMSQFASKMPNAIQNLKQNLMTTFGFASKEMIGTHKGIQKLMGKEKAKDPDSKYALELTGAERVSKMKIKLLQEERFLNEEEKKAYENKIKAVEMMNEEILKLKEKIDLSEKLKHQAEEQAKSSAGKNVIETVDKYSKAEDNVSFQEKKLATMKKELEKKTAPGDKEIITPEESDAMLKAIEAQEEALKKARIAAAELEAEVDGLRDAYEGAITGDITNVITAGTDKESRDKAIESLKANVNKTTGEKIDEYTTTLNTRATINAQEISNESQRQEWAMQGATISESKKQSKSKPKALGNKQQKETIKDIEALKKRMKDYTNSLKTNTKVTKANAKNLEMLDEIIDNINFDNFEASMDDIDKRLKEVSGSMQHEVSELDKTLENTEKELTDMDVDTSALKDLSDATTNVANANEEMSNTIENVNRESNEEIDNTFYKSEAIAQVGATFMATASMVSAAQNAFAVWGDESATAMDKIGAGFALLTSLGTGLNAVMALSNILMTNEAIARKASEIAAKSSIITKITETVTNWNLFASETAVTAGAMLLVIALLALIAVVVVVIAVIANASKAMGEQAQKELDLQKKNQELINSNQELAGSVRDLIDEYQNLQATGESTYDALEKLKEQMPDLINSYKELERNLGIDLDVESLEQAYKAALSTGNWDEVEMRIKAIETEVIKAEQLSYQSGATAGGRVMAAEGKSGLGNVSDNDTKYNIHLGGLGSDDIAATTTFKKVMVDRGLTSYVTSESVDKDGNLTNGDKNSVDLTMDLTSPTAMVNYYEALQEIQAKLTAEGETSAAMYSEITEELDEMADAYAEAKPQAEAFLETLTESLNNLDKNDYVDNFGFTADQIDELSEYNANLDTMVTKFAQFKGITEAEAKAIIEASDAFSQLANASSQLDIMASDLAKGNEALTEDFKKTLSQVYDDLPESDKTLMLTLDIADIDPADFRGSILEALEKVREEKIVAEVKLEAEELEFDESAFESYADILQDTNNHLEDNKAMAYKVALQNARMSKGLVTLAENLKDNVSILAEGNRASYEYAEAIGALKDGFEEMFGYKPSTVYIEGHLQEIQQLANGNLEVLQSLQDDLAKDYVLNMEVGTAINTEIEGMSTEEVRNELTAMLDSIDTSLEIGEGTTISDDYLNSMQAMLDQGQITEQQLEEVFRMKGIEMKVTGYKNIPGPKTTTTQTITGPLGVKYKKVIEEQSDIQVPIINGDDSNIYAGTPGNITATDKDGKKATVIKASQAGDDAQVAEFAKSADANSIDTKAFEEVSGEKETQKKIDALEEEKDLYHQINEEIEATERQLNKLERAEERAFGKQKLAQMKETIKGYEAAAKQQEEAAKLYEANAKKFGQELIDKYGVRLNAGTGVISNWSEVEARELSYREAAYRSGDEEAIEEADERWEAYQTDVANYEEALKAKNDAEEQAQDYRDQIYDKYLEGLEYQLEIKLMVDDKQLEYLEYMMSKIEDDAFATAEKIALLGDKTETLMSKSQAYNQNINDLLGKHGLTADQAASMSDDELIAAGFTQNEVDSLNDWSAELLSINQELMETKKEVEESLMAEYEAWMEDMDEEIATIEHASSVLNHYSNIIDIAGKKHLGFTDEMMQDLSRAQLEVANNNLKASKAKYDAAVQSKATIEAELEAAKARLAKNPQNEQLQQDVKFWEESLQTVNTSVQEAQDAYMTQLEATLEQAKNAYIDMVNDVLNAFEEGVSKTGKSLEKLSVDLERTSEEDDRYLEDYQKMYELNKLSRDLETKLNKSSSLNEQKTLRQQIEKINQLKAENVEMSEHDLAVLQKQVEVEQARIAMQEAQNAKTQVIRRRDSEGNWGYIYTADQEAQADAIQSYEDKMYELMDLNDTYLNDLSNSIIEAQTQMRDAIAELSEEDFASKEEYMAAVQEIQDYYKGLVDYYYDEMNKTIGYNQEVYALDLETRLSWTAESLGISQQQLIAISEIRREDYADLDEYYAAIEARTGLDKETIKAMEEDGTLTRIAEVGKQKIANEDLQTSFADTRYAQVTEYTTMEEAQADFTEATNTMVSDLEQAYNTFEQDLEEAFNNAGEDINNFKDTVTQNISGPDGVVGQSEKAADSVEQMKDDMEIAFGNAATAVTTWQSTYSEQIDLVIKANEKLYKDLGTLIERLSEAEGKIISYADTAETYGDGKGDGGSPNGGSKKGLTNTSGEIETEKEDEPPEEDPVVDPDSDSKYLRLTDGNFHMEYDFIDGGYERASTSVYDGNNWKNTRVYGYDGSTRFVLAEYTGNLPGRKGTKWWIPYDKFISNGKEQDHPQGVTYALARNKDTDKKLPSTYYKQGELPAGFDTGGYTGAWGTEGRMAMLHQKEIVLNAQDTENFLLATNVLRDIVSKIELASLSSVLNANIITQGLAQNLGNGFEQNVIIHAEFPDATNHNEIEEAFNNLVNRATQYANRKS